MNEFTNETILRIQKIVDRAQFDYRKEMETTLNGICFAEKISGTGSYHEEDKLYLRKQEQKYVFLRESIAPMAGNFKWIVLEVEFSELENINELKCLLELLKKKLEN